MPKFQIKKDALSGKIIFFLITAAVFLLAVLFAPDVQAAYEIALGNSAQEEPAEISSGISFKNLFNSVLLQIEEFFAGLFTVFSPTNYTEHHSWDWGTPSDTGTGSTTTGRSTIMTGTSPDKDNMRIKQLCHRANASSSQNFRIAFYTGGTVSNPDGATLQVDAGQVTASSAAWYCADVNVDWSKNTVSHITVKIGSTGYLYVSGSTLEDCQAFRNAATSFASATVSEAYPGTIANSGSAYNYVYRHKLVYVLYPTISSLSDESLINGQTGVIISGTGFEAEDEFGAGTSKVWLTQNNNWDTPGTKVQQTDTSWSNTSITFTVVQGALSDGTAYLWVENSDGEHNATGYSVTIESISSGSIMSTEVDFDWVSGQSSWGEVIWSTTETQGDIKLKVYYTVSSACDTIVPEGVLSGNSSGFDVSSSPLDISGLNTTTYNRLCLKAELTVGVSASPTLNDWRITWEISNQAPTVDSININPSPIDLNANSTKTVTITATITDNDGCEDVFTSGSITAVFFDDAAEDDACTQDDNDCYASLTLTEVDNTCTGAGDYTADASVDVDVWFIANPSSSWTAKVTATDSESQSDSDSQTVTVNTLNAFSLDVGSIGYGTVNPNEVSSQQAVLITTTGNAAVDVELSGENLTWNGNTILTGQQKYSASDGFNWETQGTALTGTAACHELSTGKPTSHPSNQSEYVYWKLKVPTGKAAGGPYSGTNHFDVVSDSACP